MTIYVHWKILAYTALWISSTHDDPITVISYFRRFKNRYREVVY